MVVGIAVLATNLVAAGWGVIGWLRKDARASIVFWPLLRLAQATVVVQAVLGFQLVARGASSPDGQNIDYGDSPLVSALAHHGLVEARAYRQSETFTEALRFARTEGIIPAPEPTHALKAAVDEALEAREAGEERVILFGLCGHGHFDLAAYEDFLAGRLDDPEFSDADLRRALDALPQGVPSLG